MNQERKGILRENQKFYKKKDYTKAETVSFYLKHYKKLCKIKRDPQQAPNYQN